VILERFSPLLYIRLSPGRIVIEDAKGTVLIDEVPELVAPPDSRHDGIAVGDRARDAAAQSGGCGFNPFDHPRMLIADFAAAERVLKAFLRRVVGGHWFARSPRVLLHPLGAYEGGITPVEWRAFRELGLAAGACKVYLWSGPDVSVAQRNSPAFLERCNP